MFEPEFTCARIKAEMVILNVSTPFALSELQSNINKAKFISVMTGASNHKDGNRIFPVLL
jgi:hypothetical protein